MKMKVITENISHKYDINRPRLKQRHKHAKYTFGKIISIRNEQHLWVIHKALTFSFRNFRPVRTHTLLAYTPLFPSTSVRILFLKKI